MNVKTAAEKCRPFIEACTTLPDQHPEYGKDHLYYMIDQIAAMEISHADQLIGLCVKEVVQCADETQRAHKMGEFLDQLAAMSKASEKAMRWLGWLQCAIVMGGGATLEDMKRINVES